MRFLLALVVSVALVGCGDSSKLSRSKAEDMIQDTVRFNTVTDTILISENTLFPEWDGVSDPLMMGEKILPVLAQRELVTYTESRGFGPFTNYAVSLSAKGNKFLVKEVKPERSAGMLAVIKLCERKIVEVTGIEQPEPQKAKVSFNYSTHNPTSFGETTPKKCSTEIRKGAAELKLFDDGWRVGEVIFYTDHGYDFERYLE